MLMTAKEIGIGNKFCVTSNGEQVVSLLIEHLEEIENNRTGIISPYQPVTLLLLDINMPMLNGFETTKAVKDLYQQFNEKEQVRYEEEKKNANS